MYQPEPKKTNPFYAIHHRYIPLPEEVMPWAPTWSPDGSHILFHDYNGGKEWVSDPDGKNIKCITGTMDDRPNLAGVFSYIFPDNKRLFLANELGDKAFILECEPDLYHCSTHQWLPIDLSADETPGKPCLGRRTFHLAPDGIHLAYSITRPDGLIMLICRLKRADDKYIAFDYRAVNPRGPEGSDDSNPDRWASSGALTELKSFADGGSSILFVSECAGGNADQFKMDLATGEYMRVTTHDDWDEDGAFSPDGSSVVCASWRTMNRLEAVSLMPLTQPFMNFCIGSAIAIHYVSSQIGFACDLQPWLLDRSGDNHGKLMGQPLVPYKSGNIIAANNIAGMPFWSPDSTCVLIQERILDSVKPEANDYVMQKGPAPNRLLIARLDRPGTAPIPTVETEIGDWAPTPQNYHGNTDFPGVHKLCGHHSGTATLSILGNLMMGKFKVTYDNFSNDGVYFLNGTDEAEGSVGAVLKWTPDLSACNADGVIVGSMKGCLIFQMKNPKAPEGQPPSDLTGSIRAQWYDETRTGFPELGAHPECLPKSSPLSLYVGTSGDQGQTSLNLYVSANVYGDIRPVAGAEISAGGKTVKTGIDGTAVISLSPLRESTLDVYVEAGDTFEPLNMVVDLSY